MEILVFVVALAVILIGAELFTNGIEWFGHRLNLGEGRSGASSPRWRPRCRRP